MNVLVIAAHPDDEALGCGGTMARHAACGHRVDAIFVADGEMARSGEARPHQAGARAAGDRASQPNLPARRAAAEAAAQHLGSNPPHFLDLPDNRLDALALLDIVQPIERLTTGMMPQIIYTHHMGDLNVDHQMVARAVLTAFRPQPGSSVQAIYGFEVMSSTGWKGGLDPFEPVHFVDIGHTMEAKHAALRCYAAEMRAFPHARSHNGVDALARFRGAVQGLHAAEAFTVYRQHAQFAPVTS